MVKELSSICPQELVAMLSQKRSDYEVDKEILRRLSEGDSRSEVWGELLELIVRRILYCIAKGGYLFNLKENSHELDEVVNEAAVRMLTTEAWKGYDARCGIISWLGGQNGIVFDAIKRVLNSRRKSAFGADDAVHIISVDFTDPSNDQLGYSSNNRIDKGSSWEDLDIGVDSEIIYPECPTSENHAISNAERDDQVMYMRRWGSALWRKNPEQVMALVLGNFCEMPGSRVAQLIGTTPGNVPQLAMKARRYFAEQAHALAKSEKIAQNNMKH